MLPILVAERFKEWTCDLWLSGIAGSNSASGMYVSVSCDWRVLSGRSHCEGPLTRPEEPCRVCVFESLSVIMRNSNTLTYKEYVESDQTKKERECFIPDS